MPLRSTYRQMISKTPIDRYTITIDPNLDQVDGQTFFTFGRMWMPKKDLRELIVSRGGQYVAIDEIQIKGVPKTGWKASAPHVWLVLSMEILHPLDTYDHQYEIKTINRTVRESVVSWIVAGMRPVSAQSFERVIKPSTAVSRRNTKLAKEAAQQLSTTCRSVMDLLDEVVEGRMKR